MPAPGIPLPGSMECPSCRHISKEEAPKFCSECGQRLLPAAPEGVLGPQSNLKETSAPEGEMECGQELKEESSSSLSLGSGDWQENPDEPRSNDSRQTKRGVVSEGFVDAADGTSTSDELEAVSYSACKRRKEDATLFEVTDTCAPDSEQRRSRSKRKKRNSKNTSTSAELDSFSASSLEPCSLSSLANSGLQDTAPCQSPAQQGSPSHEPGQPPSVGKIPLEAMGHPLQGEAAGEAEAATGTESLSSPAPQDQTLGGALPEGNDHQSLSPSKGEDLPTSASEGSPREKDTAQELLLPEPKADTSKSRKELQTTGLLARAPASGASDAAAEPAGSVEGAEKDVKDKTEETKELPTSIPASRDHRQEIATKDQTAVPGGKTGENEKAKPKNLKKPEGNNGNNAAPVKNEKEQRNQSTQQAKESLLSSVDGITVYFHAIISQQLEFNPHQHQVFVRGGKEFGKPAWSYNVCEMHYSKDLHKNGSLIEGSTIISKQHMDKPIPYKYVICRGKSSEEYEFIYKDQPKEGEHVNRCLWVKPSLLDSGDWHQYDDIIRMKPPGTIQKWINRITDGTRRDLVKGKQIAAAVMLDSIFSILETWNAINLTKFFTQFQQLYSVIRVPMIYEGKEQPWSALQYEEKEVRKHLWECVTKKMAPFLETTGDRLPEDCPVKSKLGMGMIVLFLVEKFNFLLLEKDLASLCHLLCLDTNSLDTFPKDLKDILETSQSWRASLVNLCHMCMDKKVDFWVCALPVLHHCMDLSPPAPGSVMQPEDTWAALEGISFSEFRETRPDQKELLKLMKKNRHLLNVDEYLFRSWFSLLPLSNLALYMDDLIDYLSQSPLHVLDCLLGTWYQLEGLKEISNRNLQSIKNTFKMLLQLLDICQEKILEEPLIQSYLIVCLKLHETTCRISKAHTFYEMPALSAEIVCRIIILKPVVVWRRLVEINFPTEYDWKESLLRDMAGRLKQERPLFQISAFCNSNWVAAGAEDSVAKCFEMCAIEAVGSVCQSQTSILGKISYNDLQKCGNLVSAVITKSWPTSRGEFVDDLGGVLNHLLTWPDIKHLFKLYGTNEEILANITKEGKKLMATADSVLTKVTNDLINGTILVGHLELILEHMDQFLDIWQLLDFGEIAERHSEDLSGKKLNQVVTVTLSATSLDSKQTTHYNLSPEVQEMAQNAYLLKDSHIFQIFWAEAAQELSESEENLERDKFQPEEVYECLYCPSFKRFTKLYQDLKSGEVTFGEIDDIFKDFVNKYSTLTEDLQTMCALYPRDQKDWIKERVQQIKEYHHLHQAVDSANVIWKVKETLGLTGDFSVLHTLLSFTVLDNFRHEKLDRINQQIIRAKKLLQDINETQCQCLEELSQRKEFISWVQEALRGITELKVFVDLASISAGENDIDVDRVACFHDAVQGYAPLLYELDTSAGFDEFMQHLKELWKALDNDHNLPTKLRDSARNLEWLKTVKESHGSVELSSLSLATAINSRGIYVIKAPTHGQKISPDTVVRLILPEGQGGHEEKREYSLEELKELLNKLMLMSGKKEHSNAEVVEVFSEVFCNVQRLVQSFINLYSAGNLLFRAWSAEVYCTPLKGVSIRLDFCLRLVGPLVEGGPVVQLLEALCRQLEDFLGHWERFVAEKRAEHFYLNYYTAEQLVYLGSELGGQTPSAAALTMLSFIKGSCTPGDVSEACRGPGGRASSHQESTVVEDLPLLLFSEPRLVDKLRVIMKCSMTCMSAFLPHCLDLDALGRCLAHLARMAGPPVQRELPHGLQEGQPNLIVCGHSEVLPAALAIYMRTRHQPLPTYDEVLLCTPETTFEEVALLLRRCLTPGSQGLGVYSLLYADQLSYEVACRAEALFRRLCMQPHRTHYRLVMVCDCEREHCYLPSAFSQHKVLVTPQAPLKDIQAYLAHHFRVPEETPSAAAVFQDRMCIGIVASERAGVGRSLFVKRLHSQLKMQFNGAKMTRKVIRLIDPQVDENEVLGSLLPFLDAQYQRRPIIFHFDVTSSNALVPQFNFLDIFPKVTCRPPKEVINMELDPQQSYKEPGMDQRAFRSEIFQRPYQYLRRFHQKENLDTFQYQKGSVEGSPCECIQHLLIYCGVINPSWSELQNFARFLNYQLQDCEASVFCNPTFVGDTLVGFKNFVVTFMIFMARDFATPTLPTSDQSPGKYTFTMDGVKEEDLAPFSLRKRWESEPHPYVFFNSDHTSMTFIGFHFHSNQNGGVDAIDRLSGKVIKKDVMTVQLYQGLLLQRVPFNVDFDQLPRHEKLEKLCLALGIQCTTDPDETYELTTDNMLKILAIEMRFRCGIPVIIMGETGCGKTRLIKFLSDLRRQGADAETVKLVKVHGGTTADMIYSKVREAEELAHINKAQYQLDTILFFDEANTTEAISCIKEVLCDHTVGGQPLAKDSGLHIIAACNPYRKHTQEMICRLESAGLGYRVSAEETAERLGSIPLRQLVYRVHALPPSLIPLVWDFGQLNDSAEKLYIHQIVQRLVKSIVMVQSETHVITEVLSASQGFMRKRQNECSFVSLRDVERCVKVFKWFYDHSEMLLSKLDSFLSEPGVIQNDFERDPVLWSLVLAVGVCYHASLEEKESYRRAICRFFPAPYNDSRVILDEITQTQDLFLHGVSLRKTIARNLALKENVFMMVICIELKIPLFLVGKPGSSKSLAKTIVADAMQGQAAHSDLFRHLKEVHLVSFQCSPHSTPQGIIGTFKQCARFQQGKDLEQYVSVVVLDEVGLAEDSPKMPLKALHPLLEDGCIEDDPAPHKKVGFIGISNWALDPAKMNRGIFVSRGSPNKRELIESARGICASEPLVQERIRGYFTSFAKAYETVCKRQDKEFFGLRDYYSLIKMVFAAAKASNKEPSPQDIAQAVLRNFSGKDDIRALDIFSANLPEAKYTEEVSTMQLIHQNLYGHLQTMHGRELDDSESRYLLVLTRNYVALQILQQAFFITDQPEIIFGSSFPKDQEYNQICRNINRVKICMETGKMVVLLNLQNLYESLYDALNQYYVYLGGQKYVDLGLGTHRVKCRVHPDFRLIVIEEKDVTAACQASLSITNSRSPPKPMSIESVMPSSHLILCRPLLPLPSIFPSIRVFSNESTLCMRWPKYWSFSFSISPSNEHPGLISFRMDWSKGEMSYIVVQNYMNLSEKASNSVPFSWRIKDYLEELWVHTQYITGDAGLAEKLLELFQKTPLGSFLAQLTVDQRQELLQCYLKDFLLLTMRVSTWEQLNALQMALQSCVNQLNAGRPEEEASLPSVHLAYHHFRSRLQNFSRILTIHPPILPSLMKGTQNHNWAGREMSLDVLAAVACAEMLTENLLKPSPQAWLRTVKNLSMPLELLCSEGYMQACGMKTREVIRGVRTHWNRIFSISLFVEHVLLETESQIPELLKLVTGYVSLLNKCLLEDSDVKTHRPFMAVMTTLRKCKDQVSESFTRFGVQPCPICLGDAQDPVCLPCDHVFCLRCIDVNLTQGHMGCPLCLTDLPDRYSATVSQEHREAIEKHARFRQMCNSFFVDLVSTMCFKDNSPPQKEVVKDLLSLLFVEKELLREAPQRCREHTKSLSPFDDVVDKTPVIRSVVLKLLLKYSFCDVKEYIQTYLSELEKKPFLAEDKTELYMLFSNCLEDSIHEKNNAFFIRDELKYLREEGQFLTTYQPVGYSRWPAGEASVEHLQKMARIRLCLDKASEILAELQDGSGSHHSAFLIGSAEMAEEKHHYLQQVKRFCARVQNDWYRVYLVRKLTSQQGMAFVQSLSKEGHPAHWVFPKEVIAQQTDHPGQMDQYLVHGNDYKAVRDAVGKAILESKPLAVETALEDCRSSATQKAVYLLLALFRKVTTLYRSDNADLHPKPQQCEAMEKFIEKSKTLSPDIRPFAISLVNNELPLLRTGPGVSNLEGPVIEMAVHAATVLLCGQSQVLGPLKNLAFFPHLMVNAFLPTMPEDLLAQAKNWKGLEGVLWYRCPNGHMCAVGECGRPMEQSFCIDCHAPIGGINHIPEAGFHVINDTTDRTQTGHVLGSPPPRGVAVVSDREMSPVVFLLIRLLTHLAMLLGATQSPQDLMNIIKPPVWDPKGFLQQHIQRDLEQLTDTLGRSADEAASVVHLVLRRLLREQGRGSLDFDAELSTRGKRNSWEQLIQTLILHELEHLDKTLLAVNAQISQDERISSNPVARIVYGDPVTFLPHLPKNSMVHCSKMWSCRKRITIEHLQHIVEQKNGKESVPILWKFLQKEAELRLVKFLPEILALQRNLVKRFQNVSEAEYRSIQSFISSHDSGEIKLPKDYCSSDLDLDTDLEVILPRRQGRGLCSTALVSYLINLHNEIVYAVEKFSKEDNSYSIDASEIADLHVISYEVERDLIPLILSNCQYHVQQGGETLQEFDLEKIQRQIISRFLQGKPRLTLKARLTCCIDMAHGIPTLVYRRDWNYEHLFMDIKNKMQQSPLPSAAITAIRGQLQSYSDACEALSAIEVTLGFLSTAGGDPNMHLNVYIQDMLKMGDPTSLVSKALNRCQLKHTIALWQFLSAHKSEQLLRLGKEPFGEIIPRYKADLSPENAKLLNTFLNQIGLDAFLLELHEMMILKLKNPKTAESFNPEWSLRDTLVSYMETKDSEIPPEMESQFPEEILLSSCVAVWKMAAELKRNRQMR
ncbi:hypothetical protein G4228_019714 [Cervus hanglu yarkandensis]|uniref:E3 ubiquitin-protein ligase RNF213 n=1 Tax=Cervus hanglu yarkandensis TaxID=84702 RepID=A0A833SE16_9CERV|nr:hypothetical protein G4228_019714 [Cervus hanglu yarkandensis]